MTRFAVSRPKVRWLCLLALGAVVGMAGSSLAQNNPQEAAARRVVINMNEDVIEGRLNQPDQVLVVRPTARKFRSLIHIRADFRREVLASGDQL